MSARTILTLANGRGIDLLDPKPADIDFDVFAEHLAKEARYNGATPGAFYSVAQHVCEGAQAILDASGDRTLAAYFLIHDTHEGVLKDDTTPKKVAIAEMAQEKFGVLASQIIDAFALLTYRHDVAIHAAAGLQWPPPRALVPLIKHWDLVMFVTEWRDLMQGAVHPNWQPYAGIKPLEYRLWAWDWRDGQAECAKLCRELLPALSLPPFAHGKTRSEHGGGSA